MRRLLLVLALLAPPTLYAQTAPPAEPPVRYDGDVLSPAFHASRRALVLAALPENGVAVLFSNPTRQRDNDVDFEYRQESYLYYLTGTPEAESVLLLAPGGIEVDGRRVRELLLVPPRNAMSEVWLGRRFGAERAARELGLTAAAPHTRFAGLLDTLAAQGKRFYHLSLPQAATGGLAAQLDHFRATAHVLPAEGNGFVRMAARTMLTETDPQRYAQMHASLAGRMRPEDFTNAVLRAAAEAYRGAEDYATWDAYRRANLSGFADGALLQTVLDRARMVKTPDELALLRRAIDASVQGHREAMRSIEPGMHEYEAEAVAEFIFARNGAEFQGYPSIVGAGENSTILHYDKNRRRMNAGDVVVMDMGAEYHGYSADVTRTVPVSGTFSPEQRAIYELVLEAQEAGIAASRAGAPFSAPGGAATRVITEGLRRLGLIQTDNDVRRFFMHGTSHHLGLYVHDVGSGPLVPGAVITVEPGIYIAPNADVDPKWWNIGVRIEDDILITDGDPVNLSAGAPRTVAAIEALMRETGLGNAPNGRLAR